MRLAPVVRTSRFWAVTWLVWFALLCILSHISQLPAQPHIVGWDKLEHFCYFTAGGLAAGLAFSLTKEAAPSRWIKIGVIVLGGAVGCFDEWHQGFVPGRSGNDPWDLTADLLGSAFAAWLLPRIWRRITSGAAICPRKK